MPSSDDITVVETVDEFRKRNGIITKNRHGRPTSLTWLKTSKKTPTKKQYGSGYIIRIGNRKPLKTVTVPQIMAALKVANPNDRIVEVYPTRFCKLCSAPSWFFIDFERQGHSTCTKCGCVNKISQENINLHLNDDGVSNKSQWDITPGMTHRDATLQRRGKILGKRASSHKRNYWRIRGKIEGIANEWNFMAIEGIIKKAKMKLQKFYYSIHDEDEQSEDDNGRKMPHGGAALAAACFYASVLEFEKRVGYKTACTLPAIQESAQSVRDLKNGRTTRDVTDIKILKYAKMLQNNGLCTAPVPQIGAKTLQFHPKSSALEHARMAIFNACARTNFHLPTNKAWGMQVGDTKQGVLYIESVNSTGEAFKAGIRKGDYVFQVAKQLVHFELNPTKFAKMVSSIKAQSSSVPVVEFTIMRKRKN